MAMTSPAREGKQSLASRLTLVGIRTQETHAKVRFIDLPDTIEASFEPAPATYRVTNDRVYVRLVHTVRILEPQSSSQKPSTGGGTDDAGDTTAAEPKELGRIRTAHLVEMAFTGEPPTDDDIDSDVINSTLYIAYPYVRTDLQRLSESVGLPSIVLPFLHTSLPESSVETT